MTEQAVPIKRLLCSSFPPYCGPKTAHPQRYQHWLPVPLNPQQHSDETALGDTKLNCYIEFNGLVHSTHLSDAIRISREGIVPKKITDSTVANPNLNMLDNSEIPEQYQCLHNKPAVWVAPNCSESGRFGTICYELSVWGSEGIVKEIRGTSHWYYYYIETIDYNVSQSASRIVVSRLPIPQLADNEYNPYIRGGPWYIHIDEGTAKYYALIETQGYGNHGDYIRNHTLEFVRLSGYTWNEIQCWYSIDHHDCKRYKNNCVETAYSKWETALFYSSHSHDVCQKSQGLVISLTNDDPEVVYGTACAKLLDLIEADADEDPEDVHLDLIAFQCCLKQCQLTAAVHIAKRISYDTLLEEILEWSGQARRNRVIYRINELNESMDEEASVATA